MDSVTPPDDQEAVLDILTALSEGATEMASESTLASLGIDSMGVVQVLVEIETVLGLVFPPEELRADTFRTVGSVLAAVARARESVS
ncbi:phosphopantetheine-binding protein [Microbacterium aurum]|uniref:phosphopantetheine-binding protein n=1 Tax=Microbacterium aurum TaxID=36805 RepID=UPI001EF68350|nr:phosphopantetheine-binding protein [Microbacterium aurum]MCG7414647.1 phosphopantetheine-binding protein [Microbacterium aurum]